LRHVKYVKITAPMFVLLAKLSNVRDVQVKYCPAIFFELEVVRTHEKARLQSVMELRLISMWRRGESTKTKQIN